MRLVAVGWPVEIDDSLASLVGHRCDLDRFRSDASNPRLVLSRVSSLRGIQAHPLVGASPEAGSYAVDGDEVRALVPEESAAAEAAIRLVFHQVALRRGGILIHGTGLNFDGRALVATGPSGAGKSTLAQLCSEYAGASILSDEIVGLLPDRSVHASPFWSTPTLEGRGLEAPLVALLGLRQGPVEDLTPASVSEGVALLASQRFRFEQDELPQAELVARLGGWVERPGVRWLTFRRHPDAAHFVRRWIHGLEVPQHA